MKASLHLHSILAALVSLLPLAKAVPLPFKLDQTLIPPTASYLGDVPEAFALHGYSVAVDGNLAAVGAPLGMANWVSAGFVKVYDLTTGKLIHFIPNPHPVMNDSFGASVAISGDQLVVGAPYDDQSGVNSGRAYIFDLSGPNPAAPISIPLSPGSGPEDRFGSSVAISGNRVVIGTPLFDAGQVDEGRVHLFVFEEGDSLPSQYELPPPAGGTGTWFGHSVAISGDRLIVGAPHENTGANESGAVHVYDLSSHIPGAPPDGPIATIQNPSPADGDWFGYSVSISGSRAIIGANKDDTGASNAGCAYAYDLDTATPTTPVATFNNPAPSADDEFGAAVAISEGQVMIGTRFADIGAVDAGIAYGYNLDASVPHVPTTTFQNPVPTTNDQFARSVAISGNWVLVGAWLADRISLPSTGLTYAYDLTSVFPNVPRLTLDKFLPISGDQFGNSIALEGSKVVVGAPYHSPSWGTENTGIVHVYDAANGTPSTPAWTLDNPNPGGFNDHFGAAVAISNGITAVGAPNYTTGASFIGAVFLFDLDSLAPETAFLTLENPSTETAADFGGAVAIDGDIVVVGAKLNSTNETHAGIVYIYDRSDATPDTPILTIPNPVPGSESRWDQFGAAVAVSGSLVVVGAPYDQSSTTSGNGLAYVFDLTSPTPGVPVWTIPNPGPGGPIEKFGSALGISGGRIVIGDPGFEVEGSEGWEAGIAYVFDLSDPSPTVPVLTLENPNPHALDRFGESIAISDGLFAIGAPGDEPDGGMPGEPAAVYVYDFDSGTPEVPVATVIDPRPPRLDDLGEYHGASFGHAVALSGNRLAVGAHLADILTTDQGVAYVYGVPEITVEASGFPVASGGSLDFNGVPVNLPSSRTFTIRNTGSAWLTLSDVNVTGGESEQFVVSPPATGDLAPDSSIPFSVTFTPLTPIPHSTDMEIFSDDADENPYDIDLTGIGLSSENDTDGDGLDDVSEYQMSSLQFDWQTNQASRVQALFDNAGFAGLYTQAEIEAQHSGAMLIKQEPTTAGEFRLVMNWLKSTDLNDFSDFPAASSEVSVNGEGEIEFEFASPDPSAFFRIEVE